MNLKISLLPGILPDEVTAGLNLCPQGFHPNFPLYWPRYNLFVNAPSYLKYDLNWKFRRLLGPVSDWTDVQGKSLDAKQIEELQNDLRWGLGLESNPQEYLAYRAKIALLLPLLPKDLQPPTLAPKGFVISHDNRNTLDDRLYNLRIMFQPSYADQGWGVLGDPSIIALSEPADAQAIVERFLARVSRGYALDMHRKSIPSASTKPFVLEGKAIIEFLDDLDPKLGWDLDQFIYILEGEPELCRSYELPEGLEGIRGTDMRKWVRAGEPESPVDLIHQATTSKREIKDPAHQTKAPVSQSSWSSSRFTPRSAPESEVSIHLPELPPVPMTSSWKTSKARPFRNSQN